MKLDMWLKLPKDIWNVIARHVYRNRTWGMGGQHLQFSHRYPRKPLHMALVCKTFLALSWIRATLVFEREAIRLFGELNVLHSALWLPDPFIERKDDEPLMKIRTQLTKRTHGTEDCSPCMMMHGNIVLLKMRRYGRGSPHERLILPPETLFQVVLFHRETIDVKKLVVEWKIFWKDVYAYKKNGDATCVLCDVERLRTMDTNDREALQEHRVHHMYQYMHMCVPPPQPEKTFWGHAGPIPVAKVETPMFSQQYTSLRVKVNDAAAQDPAPKRRKTDDTK